MILALGIGFGVRALTSFEEAPWWGLLAGLLVAPLVPAKTACGIRRRDRAGDEPGVP